MLEVSDPSIRTDVITAFPVEERFIKLPIENYLRLVDIEPIAPQIAVINALNDPKVRFVVAALSRRTGKTYISNVISQLVAYVPGCNILIISPNYSLSQISWDLQRGMLNQFEVELERSNAKDKIMELKNGSTIRMGSVSQADSVVGRSYDFILFDEAALDDRGENVFNIQLRPTLDKTNSKAVFISTPRGKNWFHKFFERGLDPEFPDWVSIHSDWRENPRVAEADINAARKVMSDAEFRQEYEANFVAMQGQIWSLGEHCVSAIEPESIDKWDVIAGLDIGFRDATAFVVIITDGVKFYIVDEYVKNGVTTDTHARIISKMMKQWEIDFIYIDSAAQQTKYDLVANYDIATINAKKSIPDGIGYVAAITDNDRLLVDESCKYTLDAMANYRWDDRPGLLKEKPVHDEHSHIADAIRYAMYSHSYNLDTL